MNLLSPTARIPDRARDALAVLAHLYLRFDLPAEAAALLAALDRLGADPAWVGRARCVALLAAGRPDEADALAETLLADCADTERARCFCGYGARACWRTGRQAEARGFATRSRAAADATLLPPRGGGRPA